MCWFSLCLLSTHVYTIADVDKEDLIVIIKCQIYIFTPERHTYKNVNI